MDAVLLARGCWALALLTEAFRAPQAAAAGPLARLRGGTVTADDLLTLAPPAGLGQLGRFRHVFETALIPRTGASARQSYREIVDNTRHLLHARRQLDTTLRETESKESKRIQDAREVALEARGLEPEDAVQQGVEEYEHMLQAALRQQEDERRNPTT